MGITITDSNVVHLDDKHENRVDTSLAGNPQAAVRQGLPPIHYVFQRNQRGSKDTGDGNPLIYALKEINGFRMGAGEKALVMERAGQILDKLSPLLIGDGVLVTPSSKPFVGEFANLLATRSGLRLLGADCVRKRTIREMLEVYGAGPPPDMTTGQKKAFNTTLARWRLANGDLPVPMKELLPKARTHFSPITLTDTAPNVAGLRIVLVDDLMSSGSTLRSMVRCLTEAGADITSCVFFLSDL